ncbi:MAG: alanine racemase [Tidjanibacter sp.]|nr:alanine racemase [Tidjanibacter sp.]
MQYKLSEIIRAVEGSRLVGCNVEVHSVMTDSRHSFDVVDRPLFAAMAGVNHDGHNYIADLYRRGVRGFLVEREIDPKDYPEAGFVVVTRTVHALQSLARDYRAHFRGTVVAVTGSTGKTVVKEWIAQVAPEGVDLFRSPRSYNSQLGVALSLLMMEGSEDMAVIEAGISRPGEMERLEDMIRPDVGIFTTLDGCHDENFSSRRQKAAEKALLFRRAAQVIYNPDFDYVEQAVKSVCKSCHAVHSNKEAVVKLYETLGYDSANIAERLRDMQPADMQFSLREGLGGSIVLSDTHNCDINSLSIALDSLGEVAASRERILILSDMLYSSLPDRELYGRVAATVRNAGVEHFIGVGERIGRCAEQFAPGSLFFSSVDEFLKWFTQDKIEASAVLVKGGAMSQFDRIVHLLSRRSHTTVLEVNLDAMAHNLAHYRAMLPEGTKMMAMVKASAYGHGDYEIAAMLAHQGVDYLAVAFADEGVTLRQKGISMPVVVLNADADSFELMVANRLEPEIYNFTSLRTFASAVVEAGESRYPIHIKIDSGMHRLGFRECDIEQLCAMLADMADRVTVRSIFSHLATADMPSENDYTLGQIATFDRLSTAIMQTLPYRPLRHINASAAMERFPQSDYDMCRLGIGLYGVGTAGLLPVSRLTTRIVQVKELSAGETVGYARAGVLGHLTKVATIPIGYADGLDRRLGSGRWSVLVGGHKAPIIGRICMDSCMIDVTGIETEEGDTVTIFGGDEGNTVVDMAAILDTIPYEIMTSVSTRVKRIYVKE